MFVAPLDVVLSDVDVVEPDLIYLGRKRSAVLTEANLRGAPDLVAEVLSLGTADRDRGVKRKLYERAEIREYWLVDPEAGSIEALRLGDRGEFERAADLGRSAGDELATPLLPGLAMPLAEIFR